MTANIFTKLVPQRGNKSLSLLNKTFKDFCVQKEYLEFLKIRQVIFKLGDVVIGRRFIFTSAGYYLHNNIPNRKRVKVDREIFSRASKKIVETINMSYFVIGVSGITCGGKTTLTKLLERSFPWCRMVHQDDYFYDDDSEKHVRIPELDNHVNYELIGALNMEQMHEDVSNILKGPGQLHLEETTATPNFDTGMELLNNTKDVGYDTSKYSKIPILILEGLLLYASEELYEKSNVRLFVNLDKEECRNRRDKRTYNPPDCPGYFDGAVWPEYVKYYDNHVNTRPGIKVFNGTDPIENIWKESLEIITCRLEETFFQHNVKS